MEGEIMKRIILISFFTLFLAGCMLYDTNFLKINYCQKHGHNLNNPAEEIKLGVTAVKCRNEGCDYFIIEELTIAVGELGDLGRVFYRDEKGFTMTDTGEVCYYLEAYYRDPVGSPAWTTSIINVEGTEKKIGSGRKNTALILAADPASVAANGGLNGGDWFLPSYDEFEKLVPRVDDFVGTFGSSQHGYWTSTQDESNPDNALGIQIRKADGGFTAPKNYGYYVRPIRAF